MGYQVAGEHGFHREPRLIPQFRHVVGWCAAADALVGGAVDQAAVQHAVALAGVEAAVFQELGRKDVMVVDAVAGQQQLVQHGAAVEVEWAVAAGEDQADGGAVEGALPGGDITQ